MNKKFVKFQLKQWLPLSIILLVFLSSVFLSTCMGSNIYAYASNGVGGDGVMIYSYPETNILAIFIPSMLLTFIMPCFVYHFRYRKESADFYRQSPMKEGVIRRHKVIIGLLILLAVVTITFYLGFLLMLLRFATASATKPASSNALVYNLYFAYYPLFWLFLLLSVSAQYFVNCFLMGLAGTLIDGILLMLVGQIFLNGFLTFPLLLQLETMALSNNPIPIGFANFVGIVPGFGVLEPVLAGERLFNPLIQKGELAWNGDSVSTTFNYIFLFLYFVLGGVASFFCLKGKDPSGEYFGKPGPRNYLGSLPIYLAGFASAFLMPMVSELSTFSFLGLSFLMIFFFSMWAIGFYVILIIFHRSFWVGKEAFLHYIITVGAALTMMVGFAIYAGLMSTARNYEVSTYLALSF